MVIKPKAKPKTKAVAVKEDVGKSIVPGGKFSQAQVTLIKNTIAKDATEDELLMFIGQCSRTGLDPFQKQIYFIKNGGRVMTQTSIDGYRLIAERSGNYAGQDEPIFENNQQESLLLAKVSVYKWHGNIRYLAAVGVAHFAEYVKNTPTWQAMPRTMLAKVAEAIALRKAFPNDLQKIYMAEEVMAAGMAPKLEIDDDAEIPAEAIEAETAGGPEEPGEPEIVPIEDGEWTETDAEGIQDAPNQDMPPMPDDFLKPVAEPEKSPSPLEQAFATNGKVLEAKATWLQLMKNLNVSDSDSKVKMAKTLMANYKKAVMEKLTPEEVDDFIAKTKKAIAAPAPKAVTPEVVTPKPATDEKVLAANEKVLACGTCGTVCGQKLDPKGFEAIDRTGWCQACCDKIN